MWIAAIIALIALIIADQRGWLLVRHTDDLGSYHGRHARVTRIIDGDTLEIDLPDALGNRPVTRIRLWGVNAPEPARGSRPAEPFAADATARLAALTSAGDITLWLESHQTRDSFGEVLVFIESVDAVKINETLLEEGLAKTDETRPHSRLTRFAQLESAAKRQGLGIWRKN